MNRGQSLWNLSIIREFFLGWEGYEDIFEIDEKHKNIKRSHFVLKVTTVDNEINRLKIGIL